MAWTLLVPEAEATRQKLMLRTWTWTMTKELRAMMKQSIVSSTPARDPEEPSPAPVLVYGTEDPESSKIDGKLVIVFSAVGCVSIENGFFAFLALLMDNLTPPSATALFPGSRIASGPRRCCIRKRCSYYNHDLGRPVVTFTPVSGSPDCVCPSLSLDLPTLERRGSRSHDVPLHVRLVRLGPDSVRRNIAYTAIISSYYRLGE